MLYGLTLAALSLSPWPTNTCFMPGSRSMWMFGPTLAAYRVVRRLLLSRFMKSGAAGTQITGSRVSASSRNASLLRISTTAGRPSASIGASHMFAW